jgi:hypothetical protein
VHSGKVVVDRNVADFLNSLYASVQKNGFAPDTPVIDLTGKLPGVVFSIQGFLPKTPWLFSGYPGSNEYALQALNRLSCNELARSWVIICTDQNYAGLYPNILYLAGLPNDALYSLAGIFDFPRANPAGGLYFQKLHVMQPLDSWPTQAQSCNAIRNSSSFYQSGGNQTP